MGDPCHSSDGNAAVELIMDKMKTQHAIKQQKISKDTVDVNITYHQHYLTDI